MGFFDMLKVGLKVITKMTITHLIVQFVEEQLNALIKRQIINNCVKMVIFVIAVLINRFTLFGQASIVVASVLIVALLLHSIIFAIPKLIRLFLTLKRYKVFPLIPMLFDGVSASEIVTHYICSWGSLAMAIKDKYDKTIGEWLPTADGLADALIKYVGLRALIFAVSLGAYFVLFNVFARPLILSAGFDGAGLRVYALPFSMAIDFLFNTRITQWVL
ncbi:MAG: hypothetical protein FWB99_01145 [Treponema sp.]|nr:hypothetical protein [Treponema sp.]